jgi:hypothetical protein
MYRIEVSKETKDELDRVVPTIISNTGATEQTMDSVIHELIAVYYRTPVKYKEKR